MEIERKKRDDQQRKRDDKNKWWPEKSRQSPLNRGAKKCPCPDLGETDSMSVCIREIERDSKTETEREFVCKCDR